MKSGRRGNLSAGIPSTDYSFTHLDLGLDLPFELCHLDFGLCLAFELCHLDFGRRPPPSALYSGQTIC
jgi:hypothetical protein